jgi:hypothetical protein
MIRGMHRGAPGGAGGGGMPPGWKALSSVLWSFSS